MSSHSPPRSMIGRPPVPPVLLPLTPTPIVPPPLRPRARSTVPDTAIRKAASRSWTRQWTGLRVPIALPGIGLPKTGWEGKGIIDNLRILAGLDDSSSDSIHKLNLDLMPGHIRRIYPIKLNPTSVEQYPPPPPRATRQNPRTWSNPHKLTRRLIRRAYTRLWETLSWVRPRGDPGLWEKCSFAELNDASVENGTGRKSRKEKKQAMARVGEHRKGAITHGQWL